MILEGDMSCRHEGGFSRNDIARKSIAYHLVLATYGEIRSNVSCLYLLYFGEWALLHCPKQ